MDVLKILKDKKTDNEVCTAMSKAMEQVFKEIYKFCKEIEDKLPN